MGRLSGFISAPIGDKARLVAATVLLLFVRVGVFAMSTDRCRRLLVTPAAASSRFVPGSPSAARVAWAVEAADRNLPGHRTCLMRSLTTEALLRLYGREAVHRIGVDKTAEDGFEAHSWIEHDGEVILGDLEDLSRFEPLPPLNGDETP